VLIVIIIGVILFVSVAYGIYVTFGSGAKDLRDSIDEHAKMHELGMAHGHTSKKAWSLNKK
tara:strand:- start:653 stop:835 length:183 start_codon:yes stop_codon:yes gene_type:complete